MAVNLFTLYAMRVRGGVELLLYSFFDVALNISSQLQASAASSHVSYRARGSVLHKIGLDKETSLLSVLGVELGYLCCPARSQPDLFLVTPRLRLN